jgi:nitrogenase molybdenum-iron protein alpha/beta subunit
VLAETIPLPSTTPDPSKVAVVGYFMDRNEEDHHGNLRELRRLLAGLSLDLCSVWLGGEPIAQLARVAEAGVILAFPHGRAAAVALAARTGARVLECELPFGADATSRWLRQVGAATGHAADAEQVIERGLAECAPKLKWIILKRLVSTTWGFAGDPAFVPGLCEMATYVGARLGFLLAWTIEAPVWNRPVELPVPCRHNLFVGQLFDLYRHDLEALDVLIGTDAVAQDGLPGMCRFLEFGFSSRHHHALYDAPFLGFAGLRCFLGRIANVLEDQDD